MFGVWSFAFLLSYFFRSANAVIAPELRAAFELDAASLGLMTSTFFAAVALAQLPLGIALDRWGPRRVVPATMLAGVAGAWVFGSATDLASLATGRALLGLGFAGVLMGALQAFGRWFPERRFATVSGLFLALGTVGGLLAGTPLAWLAEAFGWRPVFLVGAAVIAAAAGTIAVASRDHAGAPRRHGGRGTARATRHGTRRFPRHRPARPRLLAHRPARPLLRRHPPRRAGAVGRRLPGRRPRSAPRAGG
jgi:MFS family permease